MPCQGRMGGGLRALRRIGHCLALLLPGLPAQAQMCVPTVCAPYAETIEILNARHNEWGVFWGRAGPGAVVEIYGEPHRETFTALIRLADGTACLVAGGDEWENRDLPVHTSN